MQVFMLFIIIFGLTGCATTAKYDAKLAKYMGANEEQLIAAWGIPQKSYQLKNGKQAFEFVSTKTVTRGGFTQVTPQTSYESGKIGDQEYSGTSTTYIIEREPLRDYRLLCTTTFLLNESGKVESWQHSGNNCLAY